MPLAAHLLLPVVASGPAPGLADRAALEGEQDRVAEVGRKLPRQFETFSKLEEGELGEVKKGKLSFFKCAIPGLFFLYFRLSNTVERKQMFIINFADDWIRTSGIASDRSTN